MSRAKISSEYLCRNGFCLLDPKELIDNLVMKRQDIQDGGLFFVLSSRCLLEPRVYDLCSGDALPPELKRELDDSQFLIGTRSTPGGFIWDNNSSDPASVVNYYVGVETDSGNVRTGVNVFQEMAYSINSLSDIDRNIPPFFQSYSNKPIFRVRRGLTAIPGDKGIVLDRSTFLELDMLERISPYIKAYDRMVVPYADVTEELASEIVEFCGVIELDK